MYKIENTGKNEYIFFRRYMEMHFIGIFANHSEFEIIKQNIMKRIKGKKLEILNINSKNIENMKNIVFETIVLCGKANIKDIYNNILSKICNHCKYIIMNADSYNDTKVVFNTKVNCITYGLNQKSTITISSVQEEKAILYIQRNIKNIEEKEIEMGEFSINLEDYKQISIETILAIFTIFLIYNSKND